MAARFPDNRAVLCSGKSLSFACGLGNIFLTWDHTESKTLNTWGNLLYSDCFNGPPPGNEDLPQRQAETSADDGPHGHFTIDEVADLGTKTDRDLVRPCDIKGILHSHSRYCDGAHPLISMVETAREIGLEYLGISDHFKTAAHQDGMDISAVKVQRHEVDLLRKKYPDFEILQGVELDADPDGNLPVDDATLLLFDYVIVSFPENGGYDPRTFTDQVIKVAMHPLVTILGRPVGDSILNKDGNCLDMKRVLEAAVLGGTAVEVNANPDAETIDWEFCRMAQDLGVFMSISPDAHRAARLVDYRHGTEQAHDAGLRCCSILNTLPIAELKKHLSGNGTI
jgi:DNA polymerase (family X)